ncbi:hypothetical protein HPB51_026589 [Rhipicephalus microplus]|uniref:Uncharacterized protein n=1 Tax=Rhipicephalus microplus TaxID=6941 RepID=A0A9J6D2H9_RHIMP|nr:hypothetical protein HPB51_026589 [Rhipicephalus microplus]
MPEVEMVEGEEISHEEANRPDWTTALGRNKKARVETPVSAGNASHVGSKGGRRTAAPQGAMKRLAPASRLPRLPRDHIRIIVRPRDGLDVRKGACATTAVGLELHRNKNCVVEMSEVEENVWMAGV